MKKALDPFFVDRKPQLNQRIDSEHFKLKGGSIRPRLAFVF